MKTMHVRSLIVSLLLGLKLAASSAGAQQSSPSQPAETGASSRGTTLGFQAKQSFPNVLGPYQSPTVSAPPMNNSQLLHSLIEEGKLFLTVDNAIALTLENNLDIAVARYQIPFSQADLLRAQSGGATRGVTGAFQSSALFSGAVGSGLSSAGGSTTSSAGGAGFSGGGAKNAGSQPCCDPFAGISFGWDRATTPLGTTVLTGVPFVTQQTTTVTPFYAQGFLTGTNVVVGLAGARSATTALTTVFNPEVPTTMFLTVNQPLLNGFGYRANAVFIRQAKNDMKIADSTFRQQVITTVGQVLTLYYTLLSDKEQVHVAEQAVAYAQKLLSDNKKQVEIGTLAPIEVVRAESEVATDEQNLVVAQTTYKQDQERLKTAVSKRVDAELAAVDIEATNKLPEPQDGDIPPLPEALAMAAKNRPELEQAELNLRNQEYTIQAVRNRLLPSLNVFGSYFPNGLSGNVSTLGSCPTGTIIYAGACVTPGQSYPPTIEPTPRPVVGVQSAGLGQALTQTFHGNYPDYSFGVNLSFPIRNRAAQADAARAMLEERELRSMKQRQVNQVEQDVRNAEIAVTQAKAQIEAAKKATQLAQETLDAEQKKFKLGESTVFLVIQAERDLVTAEGNEAKARAAYAQALITFQQATATILEKYNIQIADAKEGQVHRPPNIPGTPGQ
jgi:outer membrane protein